MEPLKSRDFATAETYRMRIITICYVYPMRSLQVRCELVWRRSC